MKVYPDQMLSIMHNYRGGSMSKLIKSQFHSKNLAYIVIVKVNGPDLHPQLFVCHMHIIYIVIRYWYRYVP